MEPGLAYRGLSADALIAQKAGNTFLTWTRPGIEAEQITQGVAAHPARTLRAHLDRPPDAGNHARQMMSSAPFLRLHGPQRI